jgi:hypothetical protein
MCQMCDEYENELARMGLVADARKPREERASDPRGRDRAEAGKPPTSTVLPVDTARRS